MIDDSKLLKTRAELYAAARNRSISLEPLGGGTDGTVWETSKRTAIKILRKPETFATELECYRRFLRKNVTELAGFSVPRLVDYDAQLLAIEMNIIQPPRVLDFGKVTLDKPGDFSQQTLADWYEHQQELWREYWPQIRKLLSALRRHGIYYGDLNPYNITPENYDPKL
jgi:hypothetical protein